MTKLPSDIMEEHAQGLKFLADMGTNGTKLADFILVYGVEVAAAQLSIPPKVFSQALRTLGTFTHVLPTLREVSLRNANGYVSLTPPQVENIRKLIADLIERMGPTKLAKTLGVARGTIYHVSANTPEKVTPFVHSVSLLLGYDTMTAFLAALGRGVPPYSGPR